MTRRGNFHNAFRRGVGTSPAHLRASAQPRESDNSPEAQPNRERSARSGPGLCVQAESPGSFVSSRHNRGLDFAAAVHQLLENAIEFVQVRATGDKGAGLEASAG